MNVAATGEPRNEEPVQVPLSRRVAASDVASVRRQVKATAREAGLDPDRADRYTLAVNEIVINAIQHGGGTAEVSIGLGQDARSVTVVVVDNGSGWDSRIPEQLPPPDQTHGRGLWLANRMCDDLAIDSSPEGTRITLRAAPRPA